MKGKNTLVTRCLASMRSILKRLARTIDGRGVPGFRPRRS
jgi:hypothetical protein